MKLLKTLPVLAAGMLVGLTAQAQAPAPGGAAANTAVLAEFSEGEVRKIDKPARKITLKHGEIKNLGMPPMAMVFHVGDPAVLDRFKNGDQVRFKAVRQAGKYVVTEIKPAR